MIKGVTCGALRRSSFGTLSVLTRNEVYLTLSALEGASLVKCCAGITLALCLRRDEPRIYIALWTLSPPTCWHRLGWNDHPVFESKSSVAVLFQQSGAVQIYPAGFLREGEGRRDAE